MKRDKVIGLVSVPSLRTMIYFLGYGHTQSRNRAVDDSEDVGRRFTRFGGREIWMTSTTCCACDTHNGREKVVCGCLNLETF